MDALGGGLDAAGVEQLVVDLYRRHRLDPAEPESPWKVARLELGHDCFDRTDLVPAGGSGAYQLDGRWRIAISSDLTTEDAAHAAGHELGHAVLERAGVRVETEEEERLCDLIGGAVLAPRPAVVALFREHGYDLASIARAVCASPTWAALRLSEALAIPAAIVTPVRVRTRGPAVWAWPGERVIRHWAESPAPGPGLRKVHVPDRPGRVALFA